MPNRSYQDDPSTVELQYPYEMAQEQEHPPWYLRIMQQIAEQEEQGGRQPGRDGLEGYRGFGNVAKKAAMSFIPGAGAMSGFIPGFQGGTRRYQGTAVVGEAGPELVEGEFSVMPNEQTEEVLGTGRQYPGFQRGYPPVQLKEKVLPAWQPRVPMHQQDTSVMSIPPENMPIPGEPPAALHRPTPAQAEYQAALEEGAPTAPKAGVLKRVLAGLAEGIPAGLSGLSRVNTGRGRGRYGGGGGGGGAAAGFMRGYTDPTPLWSPGHYQKVQEHEARLKGLKGQAELEAGQAESAAAAEERAQRMKYGTASAERGATLHEKQMANLDLQTAKLNQPAAATKNQQTKEMHDWLVEGGFEDQDAWLLAQGKDPRTKAPNPTLIGIVQAAAGGDAAAQKTLDLYKQTQKDLRPVPQGQQPVRPTHQQAQASLVEADAYRITRATGNAVEAKRAVDMDESILPERKSMVKERIDELMGDTKGKKRRGGRTAVDKDAEINNLLDEEGID